MAPRAAFLFLVLISFLSLPVHGMPAETSGDLPLEPSRVLQFTTSEGTWISVDVSPDGSFLVFDLLGDLYRLPIEGGEATRISQGMAFDSQPTISPDGEWIAFLSDRDGAENLWICAPDGSSMKKLSSESGMAELASPEWTPDGDYVILSRAPEGVWVYELWMYHTSGGSGVQVTKARSKEDQPKSQWQNSLGPAMSPDGNYLYFARKSGGFEYNASFPMWQIARRNMETGEEDILTQAQGSAVRPVLSPDGKKLVYGTRWETRTGLRIRDLVTGEDEWLYYPVQRDDQESRFTRDLLPGFAFTPGGEAIVLSFDGQIKRISISQSDVDEIPFNAEVEQALGPRLNFPREVETGPVVARLIQDPQLSPDGERLVFSTLTHIYTAPVAGGSPRRITDGDDREFQPAWSPDGKWITYVTWDGTSGHLWKVRSDGSEAPVQLSRTAGFYSDPAWSPEGEKVVVLRGSAYMRKVQPDEFGGQSTPMDLIWFAAEGGEANLIVPSRGLGKPHFINESDRVFLYGVDFFPEKGGQGLISLRLDGSERRTHLKVLGKGIYSNPDPVGAQDVRLSPDGKWALAAIQNQLYLLAVPATGSPAEVNVNSPSVPVKRITRVGADYFDWSRDGESIHWAVGSTFYRLSMASIDFQSEDAGEERAEETSSPDLLEAAEMTRVTLEFPRHRPEGSLLLRGGRLITMRGEEIIEEGDLLIEGDRIAEIGARGTVQPGGDTEILDVEGMTIIPGLVDTHAHWFEIRRGVLDTKNWSFLANLAYGVTTGLDVQTMTNDMFAYQDLVDTGEILGPRAFSTGPGIFSNNDFQSEEDARNLLRRYKEHYRTRNLKSYLVGNREQRQWLVQAARELEMMPTTEGGLDLKLDLTHAIDGFTGNEHALPIIPLFEDVVRLFAESRIAYTPTLLVHYGGPFAENYFYTNTEVHDDPKLNRFVPGNIINSKTRRLQWFRHDEYAYPETAAQAAKILRGGGLVGVGSHGQLQGLGYHWEMWAMTQGGLTPHEVLRCATRLGAEIIGVAADLGSLEAGKLADLVILQKNPLQDIENTNSIRYVIKNGELFDGDTLNQLWPVKRTLPELWWWEAGPDF